MKFFVIIELLCVAVTVGLSFANVPAVALGVAIGICVIFGIIMFAFIIINFRNEIKSKKDK